MPPLTVRAALFTVVPAGKELTDGHVSTGTVIVKGQLLADTTPLASITWIVKVAVDRGVPVMAPVAGFRVRPAGSAPLATE